MSNYLLNARNQHCFNYPILNDSPHKFFNHFFLSDGDGIEFVDGNPVVEFQYGGRVWWTDFYKHSKSFGDIKEEYMDRYFEGDVEEAYRLRLEFKTKISDGELSNETENQVWKEVAVEQESRINRFEELSVENLTDDEFWFQHLETCDYLPYLCLSEKYFKAYYFNDNSENLMVDCAKSLARANIQLMENILAGEVDVTQYEDTFQYGKMKSLTDDLVSTYKKDIGLLTKLIEK